METALFLSSTNGRQTDQILQVPNLPFDIVIEILSRLPVKTLIRFKYVSKIWNQIISNSRCFISLQLIRSQQAPNRIICSYHSPPVNQSRSVFISSADEPLLVECEDNHLVICSSGDLGLLLLGKWRPSQQREYSLWNPATRQVRRLPEPPPPPSGLPYPPLEHFSDEFGVGLDLVADVVKVVLVRYAFDCLSAPKVASPVYVYTLNGGEGWRKLADDYPYTEAGDAHSSRYELSSCTYLKGSVYWLCWEGHIASYVVTFDLGTEVFRRINLFPDHDSKLCTAFVYRDSFAVFSMEWFKSWSVDVWLLSSSNEWIKHSTFGPFPQRLYVFGCWKDDLLVALPTTDRNDVMVFDTVKQEMRVVVPGVDVFQLFSYKETLVCIQ